MSISASDVAELRKSTGAGLMDCKKALQESNGDYEGALDYLRKKGQKVAEKRADKDANEGVVVALLDGTGKTGVVLALSCETDFVAKGDKFIALSNKVLDAVVAAGATTAEQGQAAAAGSQTVADLINDEAAIIGEKIELRRVAVVEGEKLAIYMHQTSQDLPPQVGVVVGYAGSDDETARSVAMHISFADPQFLAREDVPAAEVEKERQIVTEITRQEGKPEAQIEKIVEGRLAAFYKQVALLEQDYARDDKQKVSKVLSDAGLTVSGFVRFKVGA
jgi:elongation factor Ts